MKRRIIALLAALVIALLPMGAFAQTAVNNSGFQVQNLGSAQAAITIVYYNQNGTEAGRQQDTIDPNSSKTYLGALMSVPAGFNGSVVISSNQPVVAITNLLNTGLSLADSYGGFSSGATTLSLPLIVRGNFGINSWISVQNAGTADATVNVAYTPGSAGNANVTDTATIKPGAAFTFYQKTKTGLGDRFVGSAKITSNGQPIVAVVNQETDGANSLFSYGGFTTSGSTVVSAPLVVANNLGGQYTGIQILNTSASETTATVKFSANTVSGTGACPTPADRPFTIPANGSVTTIQTGGDAALGFDTQFATCRYIGSATITSGQPVAVIVNQAYLGGSTLGSAYAAVDPSLTTASVNAPLIQANNFGTFSGIQVQNTGSSATVVTVTYGKNGDEAAQNLPAGQQVCPTPAPRSQSIEAGASFTFIQSNALAGDPQFDAQFATCRYIGSATISAGTNGKITAIVNQVLSADVLKGDGLLTYSAFPQQ